MHIKQLFPGRRNYVCAVGLGALLALAGCSSTSYQPGAAAAASGTGSAYLARIRASYGLPPLARDPVLEGAAREQANYMARSGRLAHNTGYGRDFHTRIRKNGIPWPAAENVARGDLDPGRLFAMWMNSPGHRRNILNPQFNRYGLAYVRVNGIWRRYWALVLSR
jgi:uncharacterized protein YkwD